MGDAPGPIRIAGDGSLGFRIGAWMLVPLVPGLLLYDWLGWRNVLAMGAACFGVALALIAPAAFYAGWRLAMQRVELVDGRLRAGNATGAIDIGVAELEGIQLLEGERGLARLAFRVKGAWFEVDPCSFPREPTLALVAAIEAARGELHLLQAPETGSGPFFTSPATTSPAPGPPAGPAKPGAP